MGVTASAFQPQSYRQAPRPDDLHRHFLRSQVEAALSGAPDRVAAASDLAAIASEIAQEGQANG